MKLRKLGVVEVVELLGPVLHVTCFKKSELSLIMFDDKTRGLKEIYEIRFFVRMRAALTPPPSTDVPVTKIPLESKLEQLDKVGETMLRQRRRDLCRSLHQGDPMNTDLSLSKIYQARTVPRHS
jgi:hypothetical protein